MTDIERARRRRRALQVQRVSTYLAYDSDDGEFWANLYLLAELREVAREMRADAATLATCTPGERRDLAR